MCCFITSLLLVGPRLGLLVWWIINPIYVNAAYDHWIWGILGWIFLPWTTLMYIAIYPGGIVGFDWILLGLGVFTDMFSYFGGYREREYIPYGESIP
jgi:hypothetical protein